MCQLIINNSKLIIKGIKKKDSLQVERLAGNFFII